MKRIDANLRKAQAFAEIEAVLNGPRHEGFDLGLAAKVKSVFAQARIEIDDAGRAFASGLQEFTEKFLREFPLLELDAVIPEHQLLSVEQIVRSTYGNVLDLDEREYTVKEIIELIFEDMP